LQLRTIYAALAMNFNVRSVVEEDL